MLFTVSFGQPQSSVETFLISGSSWSNCLSYCEGTGKVIQNIILCNDQVLFNSPTNYAYVVNLLDNVTGDRQVFQVFDTIQNVLSWIESQSDKTLLTLNKQNKQFVAI